VTQLRQQRRRIAAVAREQRNAGGDRDTHRNTLHDLGEISGRVVGRKKRELCSGRAAHARDFSLANAIVVSIDLELDRLSHRVARGKDELTLQPREFRLLEYLMKHAGQVVTRTMLLENVWDYHFDPQTNVIDVHISRLRSKIDKGFERPLLHTIRGAGYMIRDGIR